MDLFKPICDAGVEAVKEAREICNLAQDNEVREVFLSALMCRNLHRSLKRPVGVEVLYTTIYRALHDTDPPDIESIRSRRADIAIHADDGKRFIAIVENKIFAEGIVPRTILEDFHKTESIEFALPVYAGVFVCATSSADLEKRKDALKNAAPGYMIKCSDPYDSRNGDWKWCFACISRSTP